MQLYVCTVCGYFRDMTHVTGCLPISLGNMTSPPMYNETVTHCPNGHGEMYQVRKGDRLVVLPAVVEADSEGKE